jgi:hypothetical protein
MDLVTILRELRRMRRLVCVLGLVAVLAAIAVAFQVPSLESRRQVVGVATTRILVDTPRSQVVEVAPKGSEILGVRANLLAALMVESVVRATIAEHAGLRPRELQAISESGGDVSAVSEKPDPSRPALTTRVVSSEDGDLPLIEIETQSSDAAGAAKLANAAVEGLRDYLDSRAALEQVSDAKRLRVTGLGGAQAGEAVRGPGMLAAAMVGLFTFGFGCGGLLVASAVLRGWRAASGEERLDAELGSGLVALDGLLESEDTAPARMRSS